MSPIIDTLFFVADTLLGIYSWIIIASAILSWLIAFNVVNSRNPFVYAVGSFLYRITEPALAPIRRRLPSFGGIDISPIVLLLGIYFVRYFLNRVHFALIAP